MVRRELAAVCAAHASALAGLEAGLCLAPVMLSRLGAEGDAALAGWTGLAQTAALGASIVTLPVWGRLADRWGRGRMLVRAQGGMALALVVLSQAAAPWQVVAARALQGALAGATPAALALVGGGEGGARRMSWVQSAGLAGAVAGPLLAGSLLTVLGLRGAVLAGAALAALGAFVTAAVRGPEASVPARPRPRGWPDVGAAAFSFFRSVEDPLLPVLARSLAPASWETSLGFLAAASRTSQALAAPFWGRLCERRGPHGALRAAAFGAAAATAAQAVAPSLAGLAAVRVLLGVFAGGLTAALYARAAAGGGECGRAESVFWTASGLRLGGAAAGAVAAAAAGFVGAPVVLGLAGLGLAASAVPFHSSKEESCAAACSTGI